MHNRTPRILLCDNQAAAFLSHRLPLALALRHIGCRVDVATPDAPEVCKIAAQGFRVHCVRLDRGGIAPWTECQTILDLIRLCRIVRPDLIHLKSPKLWCYGGILAPWLNIPGVVSHVVGLGYAVSGTGIKAALARSALTVMTHVAFRHTRQRVIVQNRDDYTALPRLGCPSACIRIVRGSGVDAFRFRPTPVPPGPPIVVLPARMLIDKGVREFVAAASLVREEIPDVRFVLAGGVDSGNPMSLSESELAQIHGRDGVEWWNYQNDMTSIFAQSTIVCLPSWREGLPKALLEAMACGRPIIAADAPGTREPVQCGVNGLLVPIRNPAAIAKAVVSLLRDPERCAAMGLAGRRLVEAEYDLPITIWRTMCAMGETCPPLAQALVSSGKTQTRHEFMTNCLGT